MCEQGNGLSFLRRRGLKHFPSRKHTEQPEQRGPAAVSATGACHMTFRHTIMQSFIKKKPLISHYTLILIYQIFFSPTKPIENELQLLEGPGFACCGI